MKRRLLHIIALTFVAICFAACSNDLDPWEDGNHRKHKETKPAKFYTMKLSLGGDFITEYDEPLRSEETPEGDTYVGLNVFRTKKASDKDTRNYVTGEQNYAYGVFKYAPDPTTHKFDKSNIDINLKLVGGYIYRFEATVLTEMTDKLKLDNNTSYSNPFRCVEDGSTKGSFLHKDNLQKIHYNYSFDDDSNEDNSSEGKPSLVDIGSGTAYVTVGKDFPNSYSLFAYPRIKRYYGVEKNIDPEILSTDNTLINQGIEMAYKSFGLRITVENLPDNTYITVKDNRNSIATEIKKFLIFPDGLKLSKNYSGSVESWEGLYSINNFSKEYEEFDLVFTWHKGGGAEETFYANKLKIFPKTRKTITINIEGSRTVTQEGNVSFRFGETDDTLENDDEVVEITNKTTAGG